jgi:transcriptional regulator with XRE-family HTH domain
MAKFNGEKLKYWRQKRKLTQIALAKKVGGKCRNSDIWKYENGSVKFPEPGRIEALARALDIETKELTDAGASLVLESETSKERFLIKALLDLDENSRARVIYAVQEISALGGLKGHEDGK